jgi:hypothetical protein
LSALLIVPIISNVLLAQTTGLDQALCLQKCSWLIPGINDDRQHGYYDKCVTTCDIKFPGGLDKNSERIEKRLKEPD